MREILFRGQTRKNGEKVEMATGEKVPGHWVYGGIFHGTGDYSIIYGGETEKDLERHVVYSETVGQYTGLKDKNGKKIFEGDILGSRYDDLFPDHVTFEVVEWAQNAWCMRYKTSDPDVIQDEDVMTCSEVIGNTHDNPELLEGGEV